MTAARIVVRGGLVVALLAAVGTGVFSVWSAGAENKVVWTVLAACLAVVTSVVSSWSSIRSQELVEDDRRPNPVPEFDLHSRVGVMLISVTNYGGSAAFDVQLQWDEPIFAQLGERIAIGSAECPIKVLMPQARVHQFFDGNQAFDKRPKLTYGGTIQWTDASGAKSSRRFLISAEQYRHGLYHGTELEKTLDDLQKLPKLLEKMTAEMRAVRLHLESRAPVASESVAGRDVVPGSDGEDQA